MAAIGARYVCFAPISEEPEGALPKYGEKINLSRLVKAELSVTMASGKIYGDDVLDESIDEFISASLNVETTDLTLENEAILYGSTMGSGSTQKDLKDNTGDTVPYGGLTYIKVFVRGGKKIFRAHYLPKVKAVHTTDTANTKAESITMGSSTIPFTVFEANNGDWRDRAEFDTFEAAKTWCDGKFAS